MKKRATGTGSSDRLVQGMGLTSGQAGLHKDGSDVLHYIPLTMSNNARWKGPGQGM